MSHDILNISENSLSKVSPYDYSSDVFKMHLVCCYNVPSVNVLLPYSKTLNKTISQRISAF